MADAAPRPVQVVTHGAQETEKIGSVLGALAQPGNLFLLVGELGAGKTCLTQGILRGLGGDGRARSPTFVLVAEHQARLPLYHVDLFRLDTVGAILDLGLEEYLLGQGVSVVEWAEKAPELFALDHLKVQIERMGETTRRLLLMANHQRYENMMKAVIAEPGKWS